MKMLQSDVEQIVPVVLARAGYERRQMQDNPEGVSSIFSWDSMLIFQLLVKMKILFPH